MSGGYWSAVWGQKNRRGRRDVGVRCLQVLGMIEPDLSVFPLQCLRNCYKT